MATKRFYATGAFRYGTRMLTAGEPVDMDAPTARLYTALNKISDEPPAGARPTRPPAARATTAPRKPVTRKRTRKAK
jgi:hypothetical protein